MDRVIDKYMQDTCGHDDADDEAQLRLWPEECVQLLLFTCAKDPSVRIRRAAMSLLTSVVSRQHSAQEGDIVQMLLLKCRDKDSKVQSQAYEMMAQLPINTLNTHLRIEHWRAVLDTALLTKQAADDAECTIEDEQSQIRNFGTGLLHQYLRTNQVLPVLRDPSALTALVTAPACVGAVPDVVNAVQYASQRLQALQLPWHSPAVYEQYCAALRSHAN